MRGTGSSGETPWCRERCAISTRLRAAICGLRALRGLLELADERGSRSGMEEEMANRSAAGSRLIDLRTVLQSPCSKRSVPLMIIARLSHRDLLSTSHPWM